MEKLKPLHKHDLTNIIKVGMFALMLLLPFLVFLPNAFYYGFNEHATNETTTEVDIQYKYQSNEVNSVNDLVNGNIYYLEELNISVRSFVNLSNYEFIFYKIYTSSDFTFSDYDELYIDDYDSRDLNYINITFNANGTYYSTVSNSNGYVSFTDVYQDVILYDVVFACPGNIQGMFNELIAGNNLPQYTDYNEIESVDVQTNIEQTITQQMYNSWQTMWQTPLFSWTNNSLLNTGLTAFTSGLGINTTSYIANFLTYELVIVAIYIVLDIVLTLFTWLTHIGQKE